MKKQFLLVFSLFLVVLLASGCDTFFASPSPPSEYEQADNQLWLTPLIETQDPASIGTLPPIIAYPGDQLGASAGEFPEFMIATPLYPSFYIISAELHFCEGQTFVKIEVKNNGPYYFQYVRLYIEHGGQMFHYDEWRTYNVWVFNGSACPVPAPAHPSLGPGASAFIYFPITPIFPNIEYDIHLFMCTWYDIPDSCPDRDYLLIEDIWPLKAQPELYLEEIALCWVGPGPLYEVVNSIPQGSSVELVGIGDVEGFLVVQEPKYQRPCWLQAKFAGEVPEEVLRSLTTIDTPLLAEGVVTGRVFKDQDGNGSFGGSDVGFPGAQVSLAPGSCSNFGQPMTTSTDSNGWYSFSNVDPGPYCVYLAKPNTCKKFSTADSYDLSVDWASVMEKNFGLEGCR